MAKKLYTYQTDNTNPYENLALEELFLTLCEPESVLLYLWQNHNTVVIGRNQNAWAEVNVPALRDAGGYLARRLSGGGAVYHDDGNLNFTFVAPKNLYDVSKQLDVIIRAVGKLSLTAQKSGRNDIEIDGRKFSGNAFYHGPDASIHHGTLLIDVNTSAMSQYLNVPPDKMKTKGVSSVRSRVVNLRELSPDLTNARMKELLVEAFGEEYGGETTPFPLAEHTQELKSLTDRYSSPEWRLGSGKKHALEFSNRFSWGGVTLCLTPEGERVGACELFSDAMDADLIASIPAYLKGSALSSLSLAKRIPGEGEELSELRRWILSLGI